MKVKPNNIAIEELVLGAILVQSSCLDDILTIINHKSFYDKKNGEIFSAITKLYSKNKPIDIATVCKYLNDINRLSEITPSYISNLTNRIASAANVQEHAKILKELQIKRDVIDLVQVIESQGYNDRVDAFDFLNRISHDFNKINESIAINETRSFSEIAKEILQDIERRDDIQAIQGIPTGIKDLNRLTNGWQKTDLIVIGGRPGMGKTGLTVKATNEAAKNNHPVLFFSVEMSAKQLITRILAQNSRVHARKFKNGSKPSQDEFKAIHESISGLEDLITVNDKANITINEVKIISRQWAKENRNGLIIVDYVALVKSADKNYDENKKTDEITIGCKQLAKELEVPLILLSQLGKNVESRGDKKPQLSDLKYGISDHADLAITMWRPSYYKITEDADGADITKLCVLDVCKNRHGEAGEIKTKYIGEYFDFEEWEQDIRQGINEYKEKEPTQSNLALSANNDFDEEPF